jgi:hypothetical protein
LRPEPLVKMRASQGQETVQIVWGDSTSPRQPAELSGLFKPRVVMPVRGDWLVADAVCANQSATQPSLLTRKIEAFFSIIDDTAAYQDAISVTYEKLPQNRNREYGLADQGIHFSRSGKLLLGLNDIQQGAEREGIWGSQISATSNAHEIFACALTNGNRYPPPKGSFCTIS